MKVAPERNFKGIWIPKEIWLNENLSIMEKLFLVEIESLDNDLGCYASNKHFSEFFGISKNRCTEIIKSLEEKKLLSVDLERKGKQIVKRIIKIIGIRKTEHPYSENRDRVFGKSGDPYSENREDNNTVINNTKEGESAHQFLKLHSPSDWEAFQMQNKKMIDDWDKFLLDFDAVVIIDQLEFDTKILFARLGQYARNWIKNNAKGNFRVIKNELAPTNRPDLKRIG